MHRHMLPCRCALVIMSCQQGWCTRHFHPGYDVLRSRNALCLAVDYLLSFSMRELTRVRVCAGNYAEKLARWQGAWIPPMLGALTSRDPRLAANVSVYGLPVPLMMDSGSLVPLLHTILSPAFAAPAPGASPDGQVSILAPAHGVALNHISYP